MDKSRNFEYFYGEESEQFSFFRIPRQLITNERFKKLSTDAKLLYGMLLDRMELSKKNGWYDQQGRVYLYYTVDEIREDMNCGNDKALKLLAELDTNKGVGLIERIRQGQGKPTKIFVKRFANYLPPAPGSSAPPGNSDLDFSDFQTSEKPRSRHRDTRGAEVEKPECNYTELKQTEINYPDLSIARKMERHELIEAVKENISYDALCQQYDPEEIDCLITLTVDVLSSSAPSLRIGSNTLPAETVKSRFWKLDETHVEYVLDCLKETTTEIHNIRAYLLTALYNAPVTIGPYYAAKVRHDLS